MLGEPSSGAGEAKAMPDVPISAYQPDPRPDFSLVHATWHYGSGPIAVRSRWLEAAARPERVEYTVGLDEDDERAVRETVGLVRAVGAVEGSRPTAVRNWNGAAALASGRVLIVISDELVPPLGWDDALDRVIGGLDPMSQAFAVMVRNRQSKWQDPDGPTLAYPWFAHPIISRAFLERLGLFDARFSAVGCDIEFAHRAYWRAFLVDAREEVVLDDRDPDLGRNLSQRRIHSPAERSAAATYFERPVIRLLGSARMRFIRPQAPSSEPRLVLRFLVMRNRVATLLELFWRIVGKAHQRSRSRARGLD
jgi:hypothetical protein